MPDDKEAVIEKRLARIREHSRHSEEKYVRPRAEVEAEVVRRQQRGEIPGLRRTSKAVRLEP
jgi:hypothetical protein